MTSARCFSFVVCDVGIEEMMMGGMVGDSASIKSGFSKSTSIFGTNDDRQYPTSTSVSDATEALHRNPKIDSGGAGSATKIIEPMKMSANSADQEPARALPGILFVPRNLRRARQICQDAV